MQYVPHPYQTRAIEFGLKNPCFGLLLDPGLGKTSITFQVIKLLLHLKIIKGVLVVAPLRPCYLVWPAEAKKWDEFRGLRVTVLHGKHKDANLKANAHVYVINPDGLEWLFHKALYNKRDWPFDMLVIDESQKFKSFTTQRFMLLKERLHKFHRRAILTGTPRPNSMIEMFSQIYILDQGKSLGKYLSDFYEKYCFKDDFGYVVVPGAEKVIYPKIAPLVLRMDAKDYLDLPELLTVDVPVEMPEKLFASYEEMRKQLRAEFEFGRVTAVNAGVKATKLRQFASGAVYIDENDGSRGYRELHAAKLEALQDLVEELQGEPLLVAYQYEHELIRLKKTFPKALSMGGGASMAQMQKYEAAWNAGTVQMLLLQIDSGSLGMNLQGGGSHIAVFTPTYKSDSYEQLIGRIWRQGHKGKTVIVHRLLMARTLDSYITHSVLEGKQGGQRQFFEALKAHALG